jgi:polyferredoxin
MIVVQMIVLKRKKQEEHNFPAVIIRCVLHIYIRAHIVCLFANKMWFDLLMVMIFMYNNEYVQYFQYILTNIFLMIIINFFVSYLFLFFIFSSFYCCCFEEFCNMQ